MKLYVIPWGDRNQASSRLRIYNIVPHLGIECFIGTPEKYEKDDLLIVQKNPALDKLKEAKEQGIKVIYDIDDKFEDEKYLEMIKGADIVTTDTEEKKKWLSQFNEVKVIPDSLDWDGTKKEVYERKGIIGWTGYGSQSNVLNELEIPKDFKLRLITTADWIHAYKDIHAQSRPWSLEMVDKYLAECDLGVYWLPNSEFNRVKGMHKLLKNWAIGLPTYVNDVNQDYLKAMEEAGVGRKYVIKSGEEIKDVEFDEKLRKYALKYEAKKIANLWKKVICE